VSVGYARHTKRSTNHLSTFLKRTACVDNVNGGPVDNALEQIFCMVRLEMYEGPERENLHGLQTVQTAYRIS
jgi:hypothetical protein